jgi:hypothetical protein
MLFVAVTGSQQHPRHLRDGQEQAEAGLEVEATSRVVSPPFQEITITDNEATSRVVSLHTTPFPQKATTRVVSLTHTPPTEEATSRVVSPSTPDHEIRPFTQHRLHAAAR